MTRSCGSCTLCCTALGVPSLGKEAGERCEHLTATGCGIYEERPEECRAFECEWLQGNRGDLSTRPDRAKVVITEGTLGPRIFLDSRVMNRKLPAVAKRRIRAAHKAGRPAFLFLGDQKRILLPEATSPAHEAMLRKVAEAADSMHVASETLTYDEAKGGE